MCMATITMTLEHYNAIVDELLNGLKSSEKEIAKEQLYSGEHLFCLHGYLCDDVVEQLLIIGIIHIHHYIIIDYIV